MVSGSSRWALIIKHYNVSVIMIISHVGDFHFLWECLKVIFLTFWGSPSQHGTLSNMREHVRRIQVDKGVKVFNVGDEFIIHVFKAHLVARICTVLKIDSASDTIPHDNTPEWLRSIAEKTPP